MSTSTSTLREAPAAPAPSMIDRLEVARELAGIPTLATREVSWEILCQELCAVDVRIGMWGGGSVISPGDLGFNGAEGGFQRFADEYLRLGKKILMPVHLHNKLRSISCAARILVANYGIDNPFGRGRLVPIRAMGTLKEELDSRREQFLAVGWEVVDTYESWKPEIVAQYRKLAVQAYRTTHGLGHDEEVPESAIRAFTQRIEESIPSREAIRDSFSFTWRAFYVQAPAVLGEGLNVARLEARAESARQEVATLSGLREVRLAELNLRDTEERIRIERELFAETAREAESTRREELLGVMGEFRAAILGNLNAIARSAQEAIKSRQTGVHQRTLASLRHAAGVLASLNFMDDSEIAILAETIADLGTGAASAADPNAILASMDAIRTFVAGELFRLGDTARLEEFDLTPPTLTEERAARERFSLPYVHPVMDGSRFGSEREL